MKLLITGGAGFAGSNLALNFKKDNPLWQITALDNLYRRGSELNIQRLHQAGIRFVHGDIRIAEDIASAGSFDVMIECSAEPSVQAGYQKSPHYLVHTNLLGALNCIEICRKQCAGLIFLSSSRVYPIDRINALHYEEIDTRFALKPDQTVSGVSAQGIAEDFPMDGPRSLYGATKLAAELMIQEYIAAYGIKGVINRCGVLAGPWQMGKTDQGFVVLWVASYYWKKKLSYIGYKGTGKQVRDILHILDLYNLLKIQIANLDAFNGEVYNIGGGMEQSASLLELSHICAAVTGQKISADAVPETRKGDILFYVSDIKKIFSQTGWHPEYTLHETVLDIFNWLKSNEDRLKILLA